MERLNTAEASGMPSASAASKENGSHASAGSLKAEGVGAPTKAAKEARSWVMAEQLRHPMGIVGLQWSPGSLQRGRSTTSRLFSVPISSLCFVNRWQLSRNAITYSVPTIPAFVPRSAGQNVWWMYMYRPHNGLLLGCPHETPLVDPGIRIPLLQATMTRQMTRQPCCQPLSPPCSQSRPTASCASGWRSH